MRLFVEEQNAKVETRQSEDFSLVLGGPLYQLLLRSHLIRPPLGNLCGRITVITALAWLPLAALTLVGGTFAAGVSVPFLYDFAVQARFLFALPLLILAESVVNLRMRAIAAQFIERQIITENVRPAFQAAISSAMRLRNSLTAEILLLTFTLLVGPFLRQAMTLRSDAWFATVASYTPAGYWYAFCSVPLFQFILIRWYYRIFIWSRFLFRVSRLDLNLVATHPDRCAGLGFLGSVIFAFTPLLIAHSGLAAGFIANRILHEGANLPGYRMELLALAAVLLALVLGPLCVFAPKLNAARLAGLRTYGRLASDYVNGFAAKWTGAPATGHEPLLGSSDIQSLADLANSFAIVKEMRVVPFGKDTIVRFLVVIALPLIPLLFTMFSLEDLMKRFIKMVL